MEDKKVKPEARFSASDHGNFSNVSVVYDSASGRSSSSSGKSLQAKHRDSACSPAKQQQQQPHAMARPAVHSKTRLGQEAGLADRPGSKVVAPGTKRQALSELEPQRVKHAQKELQAWTQCTEESDDFM